MCSEMATGRFGLCQCGTCQACESSSRDTEVFKCTIASPVHSFCSSCCVAAANSFLSQARYAMKHAMHEEALKVQFYNFFWFFFCYRHLRSWDLEIGSWDLEILRSIDISAKWNCFFFAIDANTVDPFVAGGWRVVFRCLTHQFLPTDSWSALSMKNRVHLQFAVTQKSCCRFESPLSMCSIVL